MPINRMTRFERRLQESLGEGVDPDSFLKFAGAIATSTALEKIPLALQRAAELPPEQLAEIIQRVQYTGDVTGLKNAVASKPEYAIALVELARKVLPEAAVAQMIALLALQRVIAPETDELGACYNCGNIYSVADLNCDRVCPECASEEVEDDYNTEADYYTQGEDPNAH